MRDYNQRKRMEILRKMSATALLVTTALVMIALSFAVQLYKNGRVLGVTTVSGELPGFPHQSILTGDEKTRSEFLQNFRNTFWMNHE